MQVPLLDARHADCERLVWQRRVALSGAFGMESSHASALTTGTSFYLVSRCREMSEIHIFCPHFASERSFLYTTLTRVHTTTNTTTHPPTHPPTHHHHRGTPPLSVFRLSPRSRAKKYSYGMYHVLGKKEITIEASDPKKVVVYTLIFPAATRETSVKTQDRNMGSGGSLPAWLPS